MFNKDLANAVAKNCQALNSVKSFLKPPWSSAMGQGHRYDFTRYFKTVNLKLVIEVTNIGTNITSLRVYWRDTNKLLADSILMQADLTNKDAKSAWHFSEFHEGDWCQIVIKEITEFKELLKDSQLKAHLKKEEKERLKFTPDTVKLEDYV